MTAEKTPDIGDKKSREEATKKGCALALAAFVALLVSVGWLLQKLGWTFERAWAAIKTGGG